MSRLMPPPKEHKDESVSFDKLIKGADLSLLCLKALQVMTKLMLTATVSATEAAIDGAKKKHHEQTEYKGADAYTFPPDYPHQTPAVILDRNTKIAIGTPKRVMDLSEKLLAIAATKVITEDQKQYLEALKRQFGSKEGVANEAVMLISRIIELSTPVAAASQQCS